MMYMNPSVCTSSSPVVNDEMIIQFRLGDTAAHQNSEKKKDRESVFLLLSGEANKLGDILGGTVTCSETSGLLSS